MQVYHSMKSSFQIIYLNGPSSSGKTTLAKALQAKLEPPLSWWKRAEDIPKIAPKKRKTPVYTEVRRRPGIPNPLTIILLQIHFKHKAPTRHLKLEENFDFAKGML